MRGVPSPPLGWLSRLTKRMSFFRGHRRFLYLFRCRIAAGACFVSLPQVFSLFVSLPQVLSLFVSLPQVLSLFRCRKCFLCSFLCRRCFLCFVAANVSYLCRCRRCFLCFVAAGAFFICVVAAGAFFVYFVAAGVFFVSLPQVLSLSDRPTWCYDVSFSSSTRSVFRFTGLGRHFLCVA